MVRPRRQFAVAGAVLTTAALLFAVVAAVAGAAVALEIAPGLVLLAVAAAGWLPGEARLVRALGRRIARARRGRVTRAPRPSGRPAVGGRCVAGTDAPRGPPRVVV